MSVIRAFIAIKLSPEISAGLDRVIRQLVEQLPAAPVRWVPANNIHLTVKFLGDVSIANLEILKNMLVSEVSRHVEFEISVGNLGAFPSLHRPRVIWVGVEAPTELNALQHAIESETSRLGYPSEERAFSPHLTLGRISRNANPKDVARISQVVAGYKLGFLGAMRVREVHLYRSDLRPGGAVYSQLFSATLSHA